MTRTFYTCVLSISLALASGSAAAQDRGNRNRGVHREGGYAPVYAPDSLFDRGFVFCRLQYESDRREPGGIGWQTDYPYAELNLMTRVAELTTTAVSFEEPERPTHYVVRPLDAALYRCPFIMATDVGTINFTSEEANALRKYFLKGGFLWVDDFWGTPAWMQWEMEIGKVLPPSEFPIVEVPKSHAIFQTPYVLPKMPQITSLQNWYRNGGNTSERGYDSQEAHLRAIMDPDGRILVLMSHNTDIGDSWEREGDDYSFFFRFAHDGYALGINALLYMLTH